MVKRFPPFGILTIFLILIWLLVSSSAWAIEEINGDLKVKYNKPLFSASEIWFPGKSLIESVLITNLSGSRSYQPGIRVNIIASSPLSEVFYLTIKYGLETLWSGSLKSADGKEIPLSPLLGPKAAAAFDLTVQMSTEAGNEHQGKSVSADFIFGFIPLSEDLTGYLPSPEAKVASDVCKAVAPAAPLNLRGIPQGEGEVLLSWDPPSGKLTHYLIAYGPSSQNYIFGVPNIGNVTSYTISDLLGGTTYYFVVKGVNDCAPGPFSNEVAVAIGGVRGAVVEETAGSFEILGERKKAVREGELGGGVATTAGEIAGARKRYPFRWDLVLLVVFGFFGIWVLTIYLKGKGLKKEDGCG